MKTLVTGGAGFIGSHLVDELLEQGHEVIAIDNFIDYYPRDIKEANISHASKNESFKLITRDILKMDEFPEADYVFHLAAQAGVRASWGKSFTIYTRTNIEVTQKLLEFYKGEPIKKFVYASSSSVYGDTPLPMREDSVLKPVSPYGVTKLAGENLCYLYWKNYNVPTVSLRYFTVYGPRQRPDMAIHKFVKAVLDKEEIVVFGDGEQTRDFTYIADVLAAMIRAAEKGREGSVYNIGGGTRISVNELIEKIEAITKKELKIKFITEQKGDVRDTWADVSKAKKELDWTPKTDINEGLAGFVNWMQKE
jgi:nucleoside-diphosphate-sugar epimerase